MSNQAYSSRLKSLFWYLAMLPLILGRPNDPRPAIGFHLGQDYGQVFAPSFLRQHALFI